jgi:flagellar basal body-associated protein FliL
MTDEFDEIEPGRRSGAHRQESAASSNIGAISLVIVLALVAVLLVVAAINIIFSSMGNPESKIADPPASEASESTSAEPSPSESEVSVADDSITVDVLNGSGVAGAAKNFSEAVEEKGWTLGQVGNYSTNLTDSTVYYHGEDNAAQAKLVAESLGVSATEASEDFDADITVVICSDIADRGPEPSEGAESEETGDANG